MYVYYMALCLTSDLEIINFEKETVVFAQKLSQFEKVIIIADPSNYEKAFKTM